MPISFILLATTLVSFTMPLCGMHFETHMREWIEEARADNDLFELACAMLGSNDDVWAWNSSMVLICHTAGTRAALILRPRGGSYGILFKGDDEPFIKGVFGHDSCVDEELLSKSLMSDDFEMPGDIDAFVLLFDGALDMGDIEEQYQNQAPGSPVEPDETPPLFYWAHADFDETLALLVLLRKRYKENCPLTELERVALESYRI